MKKRMISFLMILLTIFIIPSFSAKHIYNVGENVVDEGNHEATRFVAGNNIKSTSIIDGISFIAGQKIDMKGSSTYAFYAGSTVDISGKIEKDLFAAGNIVTIEENAVISRDAYLAGSLVKVSTNIGRDLRAGGETVDIRGITINGNASIYSEKVLMDENTKIVGKLSINEETEVEDLDKASIAEIEKVKDEEIDEIVVSKKSFSNYLLEIIVSVISTLISLLVLFYLIPSSKKKIDDVKIEPGKMLKDAGVGLIVLIVVPILAIIAMITVVLIPVSIISLLLYGVCIYLSMLLSSYIVGLRISRKVFKKENLYITILSGALVLKLICYIPLIGGLVRLITLLYGVGICYKFIINKKKTIKEK